MLNFSSSPTCLQTHHPEHARWAALVLHPVMTFCQPFSVSMDSLNPSKKCYHRPLSLQRDVTSPPFLSHVVHNFTQHLVQSHLVLCLERLRCIHAGQVTPVLSIPSQWLFCPATVASLILVSSVHPPSGRSHTALFRSPMGTNAWYKIVSQHIFILAVL